MTTPPFPAPHCVVITGASRGLGAALANEYAAHGRTIALVGRDERALASVSAICRARGADSRTIVADVTEGGALTSWLAEIDKTTPIELLIVNAGVFEGRRDDEAFEALDRGIAVLRVNLEGAVRTVAAVLPGMLRRRSGRIVLVSSLAALMPQADAAAYSASKAGLAAYGEALSEAVAAFGVGVTVVLPGHIATQQTGQQVGSLPLMTSPEKAARIIKGRLDRGRARIAFPAVLVALIRLHAFLPKRLRYSIGRLFRFHVRGLPAADA